jgi:hypothetical protein
MKLVSFSSFDHWRKKLEKRGLIKTSRRHPLARKLPPALLRSMSDAYPRAGCYRREKVREIKEQIARGSYHVSGREIVDKWFPWQAGIQTTD